MLLIHSGDKLLVDLKIIYVLPEVRWMLFGLGRQRMTRNPALFKNLNYFDIWRLKIETDQRASLLAMIIVFMLAGVWACWWQTQSKKNQKKHTHTHTEWKHSGAVPHRVHESVETRQANHRMIPLVCITVVFSVNRWLMRPSNCVWEIERHWGRRRYIKSRGRQRDREKKRAPLVWRPAGCLHD